MSFQAPPAQFIAALESIRRIEIPHNVTLKEISAPRSLAPYSAGIAIDSSETNCTLIILYDPAEPAAWQSRFRLILALNADIENSLATEQMLAQVAWSWLRETLDNAGAGYHSVSGTVTRVISESFGMKGMTPERGGLEIRASWSPYSEELTPHVEAICRLVDFISEQTGETG
ncbi:MAG: DUF3000 family protein [Varibaculum sp.]|nr:DUF3000 family protein [Varibaculum sp.]